MHTAHTLDYLRNNRTFAYIHRICAKRHSNMLRIVTYVSKVAAKIRGNKDAFKFLLHKWIVLKRFGFEKECNQENEINKFETKKNTLKCFNS